jgi:hypothetical protein
MFKFTACLSLILATILCCVGFAQDAKPAAAPQLSAAQKLEIRDAQLAFYDAKAALEQTPQYQQMNQTQTILSSIVQKVLKEAGVDTATYQLQNDLTLVKAPAAKAGVPPKPPVVEKETK